MNSLKRLIGEIHRRSLWQVLGIYVVGSWIVFQVAQTLTEGLGLPDWVPPVALILLLIGLPIVIATAFVQEGIGSKRGDPLEAPAQVTVRPDATAEEPVDSVEAGSVGPPAPAAGKVSHHRLFTWRNALLGGGAAFALLGVITTGYMLMRTLGIGPAGTLIAQGVLEERGRIVIAQFESASGDESLAEAATEALRVDLSQSPVVRVVEPRFVATVLERMARDPSTPLDRALATELAIREGIPAVVAGEINAIGRGFVLTAELVAARTGEVLVSQRETARDTSAVIDAIDELSKRLRERVGESLRSVRADAPLEAATTASLEALRKFSQGVRAIDLERDSPKGIALLEEAIALDSGFAMALRKLGNELRNMGQERSRWTEALRRSLEHSERLTERERYLTVATFHMNVTGDVERAMRAFEGMLELDPLDNYGLGNLALIYDNDLRDPERGEELMRVALGSDSSFTFNYTILIQNLLNQGKLDEAEAILEAFARAFPGTPGVRQFAILIAANGRDYERVDAEAASLREQQSGSLFWRSFTSRVLAGSAGARGRLASSLGRWEDAAAANEQRGLLSEAFDDRLQAAWTDLLVRGSSDRALRAAEDALARYPLSEIDGLDRPYLQLASLFALAGRPARARGMLEEWQTEVPGEVRLNPDMTRDRQRAEGDLASVEGRHQDAMDLFRTTDEGGCRHCSLIGLARAYEGTGARDSAIAAYERYVDRPWTARLAWDATYLGPTYARLGQLYDGKGDLENAAKYYALFTDLWAEADEELQPRVRAAQTRLEEIVRERG